MKRTIICYGDSNTYGYDPRLGCDDQYDETLRWTGILKQHLNRKVENHGLCGRCIPHTESQLSFLCEQVHTWIQREGNIQLWIMLGTNDLLQTENFTAKQTAERMEHLLFRLLAENLNSKLQIHLIAPPLMQYGAWVNEERIYQESRKLGEAYRKLTVRLLSQFPAASKEIMPKIIFTNASEWNLPLAYDGVHLSEEGHRKFAEQMLENRYSTWIMP